MTDQELFKELDAFSKENGFTYVKLAEMLSVTKNTINNWKNGGKISTASRRGILMLLENFKGAVFNHGGQGNTIIGNAHNITYGKEKRDAINEMASRADERKKILDRIMALDSIPAEVKIIIYNELNKEN